MPRTVHLAAALPAPSDKLFYMYLDPEAHAAFTGAPVSIGLYVGVEFKVCTSPLLWDRPTPITYLMFKIVPAHIISYTNPSLLLL
jgi:hypothetical protein